MLYMRLPCTSVAGYSYSLDTATAGTLAVIVTVNPADASLLYWKTTAANAPWNTAGNWSTDSALSTAASIQPLGPTAVVFNSATPVPPPPPIPTTAWKSMTMPTWDCPPLVA